MRHAKSSPGVAIRYATQGAGTEPVAENFVQASMPKVLLALLLLAPFAAAQSTPLSKLPAHVKAPKGKLTLFADYGDVRTGEVALYLVNRTGKKLSFESQDGQLYIKLEAREKDGTWARARGHMFSWCGNSYFMHPELPHDHFFLLRGQYLRKGESREVRYRFYGKNLVSNAGKGRIDPAEIKRCRADSFAARYGNFETVAAIAEGKVATTKRDHIEVRPYAVALLGRFKHARCVKLLTTLLRDADPAIRKNAASVLGTLGDLAKPTRPALKKLAEADPDAAVRAAAKEALSAK